MRIGITNSKERSVGKMTNFEEQNRGNMTGLAESFENRKNLGGSSSVDNLTGSEEGKKTVAEHVEYFNKYLSNPKELPNKYTSLGVPTMGINQVYLKQSKKKSVSWAEGLSDVNNLTDLGIEALDTGESTNFQEERQSKNPGIFKRLSNRLSPKKEKQSMLSISGSGKYKKLDEGFFEASTTTDTDDNGKQSSYQSDDENNASLNVGNVSTTKEQRDERLNSSEELPKADKKLIDAIKKLNFKQAKELIKKRESIILTASTESILKEAVKEAEEKITDFPEKEQNKQESKLQKIKNLINEKLYVREDDHAPPVNDLDRAELEKAEFEKLAAASTELEKVESEAKFEKLASVQDLYLDHAQPVNANISEEDVNSTTSDQITPVGSDELDSSSGEPLYSTIDSGSSDPQLDGQQSPQSEILTNTLDDDVSSLSSDEHSSAFSNAGDTSTTENVIDNEEEPVVDDKDDQPAGKEGDSKSPVTFIIEGDDNKVVFEQDNSVKTHPQNAKLPVIATWTSAITGVLTGAAAPVAYFAFSASLLVAGIIAGVGACCLVAAVVIYCCTPKSQVENNEVEKSFNMKEGLTVTPV